MVGHSWASVPRPAVDRILAAVRAYDHLNEGT